MGPDSGRAKTPGLGPKAIHAIPPLLCSLGLAQVHSSSRRKTERRARRARERERGSIRTHGEHVKVRVCARALLAFAEGLQLVDSEICRRNSCMVAKNTKKTCQAFPKKFLFRSINERIRRQFGVV